MRTRDTLAKIKMDEFSPLFGFSSAIAQTVIPQYIPRVKRSLPFDRKYITLADGDKLALALSRPKNWQLGQRITLLIHGLSGCEDSPYIRRISEKLFDQGFFVVRLNLRTCGPGRGLARNPYHCGRSDDTKVVVQWLADNFPNCPITQLGFSLSANITIKMLGECGSNLSGIDSAVCVSPPLDLHQSARQIVSGNRGIFDRFFIKKMRESIRQLNEDFEDFDIVLPSNLTMKKFDDFFTAPRSGFENADDYYTKVSGKNFIKNITLPCLLLHSLDDPVAASACLSDLDAPDVVDILELKKGGHVGFWRPGQYWMDEVILRWLMCLDCGI